MDNSVRLVRTINEDQLTIETFPFEKFLCKYSSTDIVYYNQCKSSIENLIEEYRLNKKHKQTITKINKLRDKFVKERPEQFNDFYSPELTFLRELVQLVKTD